jgi:SurA-like protein
MRRRLTRAVTAAAALALTGCSTMTPGVAPGVAADVDGHTITTRDVDDLAEALCAVNTAQPASGSEEISGRQARGAALSRLIQVQLAEQLGEDEGLEPDETRVAQQLQGVEAQLSTVPDDQLATFMDSYAELVRGADLLTQLGRRSLTEKGEEDVQDDAALTEGGTLLQQYASDADVEVSPRFGSFSDGQVQPGDGSLSVPVSQNAVDGAAESPSPEFLSGLPATQKCA